MHLTTESFYREAKLFFISFSTTINDRRIEVINCIRDKKKEKIIDLTILYNEDRQCTLVLCSFVLSLMGGGHLDTSILGIVVGMQVVVSRKSQHKHAIMTS